MSPTLQTETTLPRYDIYKLVFSSAENWSKDCGQAFYFVF